MKNWFRYKEYFIITLLVLLINPMIIYLLTDSFLISLIVPLIVIVSFFTIYKFHRIRPLLTIIFNVILFFSILIHAEVIFTNSFEEYIIENLYSSRKNYYFNHPYLDKTFVDSIKQINKGLG